MADATAEKQRKKEKKEKKRLLAANGISLKEQASSTDAHEGSEQHVQTAEVTAPESKKKDKKRKLEGQEGETGVLDLEGQKKKKKKRKVEEDNGDSLTKVVTPKEADGGKPSSQKDGEKKKKKRKHRDREDEPEASEPPQNDSANAASGSNTPANGISDTGSKEVKEKKKKNKREVESKGAGATTADSSPATKLSKTAANGIASRIPGQDEISEYATKNSVTITSLSDSSSVIPILSFSQLGDRIPSQLNDALNSFKEPTPIQAYSWPAALDGKDVVGIAETGSGKTLAFGIPALARLAQNLPESKKKKSSISVLVVAPTRELALQTHETLSSLGAPFGLGCVAVFGGVDKEGQKRALASNQKSADGKTLLTSMIAGTPGRILDLVSEGACDLSGVNYLVLDEADRMLDKGFENDIRAIISHTKQGSERQTLMFSATWPEAVRRLASSFQRDPFRVTIGSDNLTANRRVEQSLEVFDNPREKDDRLLKHLHNLQVKKYKGSSNDLRILIFVLYKKEATRVESTLQRQGYSVAGIHGDMNQNARIAALEGFKTGQTELLVATDVAARGLDIPNVAAVINYSFPLTIEDYIHRIGRTGRGGRSGKSITFFTGENHERSLAGELARVLREAGFNADALQRFPMTIKKKTHSAYGAFFRDDVPAAQPTRLKF